MEKKKKDKAEQQGTKKKVKEEVKRSIEVKEKRSERMAKVDVNTLIN
jgi:hypothetical protein